MTLATVKTKIVPKQARAKARIEAILTATDTLLKTVGTDEITTTAIARSAGVPVGSVYQYFESKADILEQLYSIAYRDIEVCVEAAQDAIDPSLGFEEINRSLLQSFWRAARAHPTFRPLTRWANREHSFIEVTPIAADDKLGESIKRTIKIAGLTIPASRREAMIRTATIALSSMVDVAIEEEDEAKAQALIDELAIMLARYLA